MNTKEIKALEGYFKTNNEHWNSYAFEMLCEVIKQGNYKVPEAPLNLFSRAIDIFQTQYETPLQAVESFSNEVEKEDFDLSQRLYVYEHILKYLKYSEFDKADTEDIKDLLKSQICKLKSDINRHKPEYTKPLVGNIRVTLKELIQKELSQLPETLQELDTEKRINVLCKLIPYVLPRVKTVHSDRGEPESESNFSISGFQW